METTVGIPRAARGMSPSIQGFFKSLLVSHMLFSYWSKQGKWLSSKSVGRTIQGDSIEKCQQVGCQYYSILPQDKIWTTGIIF